MWDSATGQVSSWYNLRPSCWLSVIAAGGVLLAPEGGGGCSCGNWLEASVGFVPVSPQPPRILPYGGNLGPDTAVRLLSRDGTAELRYTLDGTTPTARSPRYRDALTIDTKATVKAVAITPEGTISPVSTVSFEPAAEGEKK